MKNIFKNLKTEDYFVLSYGGGMLFALIVVGYFAVNGG